MQAFETTGKYFSVLAADCPSTGWTITEHAGDLTPDQTQWPLKFTA